MKRKRNRDFCDIIYISSCGGHLVQILKIAEFVNHESSIFVVNDRADQALIMKGRTVEITHATRNWKQLINIYEAIKIIFKFRPKVILSTGAAPAVPFSIVGKIAGAHIIFVESLSRITQPSLTGRIMYYIADEFYVQWPRLLHILPKAKYVGGLL